MKYSLTLVLVISFFINGSASAQTLCEFSKEEISEIIHCAFDPILRNEDSIIIKKSYSTACLETNSARIKIMDELSIYHSNFEEFYSIELIVHMEDFIKIVCVQPKYNYLYKIFLYKENGNWQRVDNQYKWQVKLKDYDYLYYSIKTKDNTVKKN